VATKPSVSNREPSRFDTYETRLAAFRIPDLEVSSRSARDDTREDMLVCMPTVVRRDDVEYVSNAVKSWRAITVDGRSPGLRRLIVFDMNSNDESSIAHQSSWLNRTFASDAAFKYALADGWLVLEHGGRVMREPRMLTHGDSVERVRWRAKEALDYALVLQRCSRLAKGRYVAIVQDDVLFTRGITEAVSWLDEHMAGAEDAWFSASLFDVGDHQPKAGELRARKLNSSNMVARVYDSIDGQRNLRRFVRYLRARFDESPVDWLADQYCAAHRRKSYVMLPNPVRHRGAISSFADNKRTGLLT
jgi:N-Acetylglucosaminyltransferase-IV (GnT-IV) conserved region